MFEFDAGKLLIIGIVALIVIGPKELPRVMRQVGQVVAKLRRLGAEFQAQFMEAIGEADIEDIKADVRGLAESAKIDLGPNPPAIAKAEITTQRPGDTERAGPLASSAADKAVVAGAAAPGTAAPATPAAPHV